MATTPIGYSLAFSFSAFEAASPSTPKPGASLDSQFNAIASSVTSIIASISDVRRADGALNNGSVGPDQLSATVYALLISKLNPRGLWVTARAYAVGDLVRAPDALAGSYVCGAAHTSGTFATDKTNNLWIVLDASDVGGANMAIPAPGSGDTGKWLFATGANNPTWQPLNVSFTGIANGTAAAPAIAFARDATTGLYSPQAGAIGFSSGGALALEWNASGLTMNGSSSLLQLGRDVNKQSHLSTTAASGNAAGQSMSWTTDNSGYVTVTNLYTQNCVLTLQGGLLSVTSNDFPTSFASLGADGELVLNGSTTAILFGENVTNFNRWNIGYDQPSNEFRFTPLGSYDMRYTAGTFYIGTQSNSLPAGWGNGIATYQAYIQYQLIFGQNGANTFSINYAGVANLGVTTVTSLTVNGVVVSTGTATPTGSIVEYGPVTSGSAATVDAAAGRVVTGFRSDGAGNFYIRTKTLVLA